MKRTDDGPARADFDQSTPAAPLRLTWMGVANWLFEVGDTRVLYNAYFSRIPQEQFYGGPIDFNHSRDPHVPDIATIHEILETVTGDSRLDYLLTGHSHFDHSFDAAAVAKLSGAQIIGARSTTLQALAQGTSAAQCTTVDGGECIRLAPDLKVYVVRWAHGLADIAPELSEPRELDTVPEPDPTTGGLYVGGLDAFPNGGGARGYLFTYDGPHGTLSWFITDASTPGAPDASVVVDGIDYGRPLENLQQAMHEAGLDQIDLWVGLGVAFPEAETTVALTLPILRPASFIPHHFDALFEPFKAGLAEESRFTGELIPELVAKAGAQLIVPRQYMDAWYMSRSGLSFDPNLRMKERLGIPA